MTCKECKDRQLKKILAGADKAMIRYTKELREENDARQKNNNKNEKI